MKTTLNSQAVRFRPFGRFAGAALTALLMTGAMAQTIIPTPNFFDPDFEVRRPGGVGILPITTDLANPALFTDLQSSGNVSTTLGAKGLVQAGLNLGVATADLQLYSYTANVGDTLVFGRQFDVTTGGLLAALDGFLGPLLDNVVDASLDHQWSSTVTLSGLNLVAGQYYTVNFTAATGANLPTNALGSLSFELSSGGTPIADVNSSSSLDVLNLLSPGVSADTENYSVTFQAPSNLTQLTFTFEAESLASLNLLGDLVGGQDQNVVTVSGLTFISQGVNPPVTPGDPNNPGGDPGDLINYYNDLATQVFNYYMSIGQPNLAYSSYYQYLGLARYYYYMSINDPANAFYYYYMYRGLSQKYFQLHRGRISLAKYYYYLNLAIANRRYWALKGNVKKSKALHAKYARIARAALFQDHLYRR